MLNEWDQKQYQINQDTWIETWLHSRVISSRISKYIDSCAKTTNSVTRWLMNKFQVETTRVCQSSSTICIVSSVKQHLLHYDVMEIEIYHLDFLAHRSSEEEKLLQKPLFPQCIWNPFLMRLIHCYVL